MTAFWYKFMLECDHSNCPARGTVEVTIHDQDFKFCQHHYNRLEASIVTQPNTELIGVS